MNTSIVIRFLTPYVSSITRDQDFVHSPLPLDGALAHAAYWQALVAGRVADSPTSGRADPALMDDHVTPVLDGIFATVPLGDHDLLDDPSITEQVYSISSGFPLVAGQPYVKLGARWVNLDTNDPLVLDYEVQPIRKRVPVDRLSSLGLGWVSERGGPITGEPETGKGVLKAIDNRITTWRVYEYVWLAQVRDRAGHERLAGLLEVLKYQGLGKKRTAGLGKVFDYQVEEIEDSFPSLHRRIRQRLFLEHDHQLVLLRPLPYDAIMLVPGRVVMTNLMVESGCGYRPPYWSDRRVVVREGTIFRFLN
jgi:hypothetical protein